jgi:hypothetical protein
MVARATDHAAQAAFNAAVVLASRAFRVPQEAIRASEGRRNRGHCKRVVTARRAAVYLAATAGNLGTRLTARVSGLSPPGVLYAVRAIEDRRDNPQFDARLSRLEQELMA